MKKLLKMLLLAALICVLPLSASAKTFTGSSDWKVVAPANLPEAGELESNFKTADMDDVIAHMQPGDTAEFALKLANNYNGETRWYMLNNVIQSLEDKSLTAQGGGYTYTLIYTDHTGAVTELFNSDTIGGEGAHNGEGEGLNEATSALDDYFYLDTLQFGQSGSIKLTVHLDGETQGNAYQDTLAELEMRFAVEPVVTDSPSGTRTPLVVTGDETNLTPFIIAALVSGVLLLIFAIFSLRQRKNRQQKGGAAK